MPFQQTSIIFNNDTLAESNDYMKEKTVSLGC